PGDDAAAKRGRRSWAIEHQPGDDAAAKRGRRSWAIEHQPSLSAPLHRLESKTLMTTRQARIGRNKENYCGW
ncbi:hypothetical protein C3471_13810, partial [Mycobacterium kansasii]